jgi:photosystem II stability/assembly factor-like uncharacterized protein
MAEPTAYTSKDGALWVFPEGPNHAPGYVSCTDADDITEPKGDIELIRCFDPNGNYKVVGTKISPPDAVTTSLTSLTFRTRSLLEKIRCEYGLMFLQRDGGRADSLCEWNRALILSGVRNTEKSYGGVLMREEDVETTRGFSISANPPVIDVVEIEGHRKTVTEDDAFNDVAMLKDPCGLLPITDGVAVSAGAGVYASGDVWITHDGGQTWAKTVTQPNLVASNLMSCAILDMCHGVRRIIVAEEAAANSYIAYSDDDGATWITVKLLAAATAHGVTHGGGIFALDERHIWLASALGFIYFSDDGGETWTGALAVGGITTDLTQIEFTSDGLNGYAGTETGVVIKTVDGGLNWSACDALAGTDDIQSVCVLAEDYVWVGDDSGGLYWTENGGTTWTQRTGWVGSGIGAINDIGFANDYVGFIIADLTGPHGKVLRTIDGGYSWKVLTADTNDGLTALAVGDENYAVYVGLVSAATGFIGVVEE